MFDNLDYNQYAKMRQRGLERQAQQLQQKQAALQAAQNKPKKSTLEEALGGLVTGIGERLSDIGNTAKNVGKTAFGWFNELVSGGQTDNTMKDDSKRRNDIAKKYGFNSYSEAINSDKVGDDFWNEIKGSNAQTKKTLDTQINDYRNSASGKLADSGKQRWPRNSASLTNSSQSRELIVTILTRLRTTTRA